MRVARPAGGRRDVRDLTVITLNSAAMPRRPPDGFGLYTVIRLAQTRAIIHDEMSGNRVLLDLARIGRRLRGLVGRNQGLPALIAYLSGELRPAD